MKNPASQNNNRTSDSAATLPAADEETGGATGALAVQQPPPSFQDSSGQSDPSYPEICGFTPVIYLKAGCPYCFKLRLALLEAGLMDRVAFQEFEADTQEERRIRTELSRHFFALSFPTAEIAPGRFEKGSDALIEHFLSDSGRSASQLTILKAYLKGPFAQLTGLSPVTHSVAVDETTSR